MFLIQVIKRYFLLITISVFTIIIITGIWRIQYLPFLDYPSHLFRAHVLINYHNPLYAYYHKYFAINWGFSPNQFCDFIVFLLSHFFPVEVATKIFFTIYIILLPLSLFYFLKCVNPENKWYALLASTLTFNNFLLYSNQNFIISIPLFLIFLGHWYKNRHQLFRKTNIINALFLLVLYYSHMLSFVCALIIVLTILIQERKIKEYFISTALGFFMGFSIFLIWIVRKIAYFKEIDSSIYLSQFSSLGSKISNILQGISPSLIFYSPAYLFIIFFMIIFGLLDNKNVKKYKSWKISIFILICFVYLLPQGFVIYAPGQRVALLGLLLATVIFSNRRIIRYIFVFFMIIFTLFLRKAEMAYLGKASAIIEYVISPFKEIPQYLKNKEIKVLPLVLYPYTLYPALHRSFEYYNIINGGINPYHFVGPDQPVVCLYNFPKPDIYKPSKDKLTKEMLKFYDVILIIGRDGYGAGELLEYISNFVFKEVSGNKITGVFSKI